MNYLISKIEYFNIIFLLISITSFAQSDINLQSRIYGQFNISDSSYIFPANFTVAEVHFNKNIFDLPIAVDMVQTLYSEYDVYQLNQFKVGLDYRQLQQNLQQKAIAKVSQIVDENDSTQIQYLDSLKQKYYEDKYGEFMSYKDDLKDIDIQNKIKKLDDLPYIEKALEMDIFKGKVGEYNRIMNKYNLNSIEDLNSRTDIPDDIKNKLYKLHSLKQEYEHLLKRKEDLLKLKREMEVYINASQAFDKYQNTDYEAMLRDPKYLNFVLGKFNVLQGWQKVLAYTRNIRFGTSNPYYSKLSFSGVRMNGVFAEFTPGKFYFSIAAGQLLERQQDTLLYKIQYKRNVASTRIGYGKPEESHLYFVALRSSDDQEEDIILFNEAELYPSQNFLVGTELGIRLFKDKFIFQSEILRSITTSNLNAPTGPDIGYFKDMPSLFNNFIDINSSSFSDIAIDSKLKLSLFEDKTIVGAEYRRVGAGFRSFASYAVILDLETYKASITQKLFKNRLAISSYIQRQEDDLVNWKFYKTTATSYGCNAHYHPKKGPMVSLNYAPMYHQNNSLIDSMLLDNTYQMINLTSTHQYEIVGFNNQSTLALSKLISSGNVDFNQDIYNYSHQLFVNKLIFSNITSVVYPKVSQESSLDTSMTFLSTVSGTFPILKKWKNTIGVSVGNRNNSWSLGYEYYTTFPIYEGLVFDLGLFKRNDVNSLIEDAMYVKFGLTFSM